MSRADIRFLNEKIYIGGVWSYARSGSTLDVANPATDNLLGKVPNAGRAEAEQAVEAAREALPEWASRTSKQRADALMQEHQEDLARPMTLEQGKPLAEARGEIAYGASFLRRFPEEARRTYGGTIPGHERDKRILTVGQPVGVVAAITPWNFPNTMIARKMAPVLAAGCTLVCNRRNKHPFRRLRWSSFARWRGYRLACLIS